MVLILALLGENGDDIGTGSSQSTPITVGMLILLHQHLYNNPKKPNSWVELLEYVKERGRKIGNSDVFGLGILDTEKLFPDIFKESVPQ